MCPPCGPRSRRSTGCAGSCRSAAARTCCRRSRSPRSSSSSRHAAPRAGRATSPKQIESARIWTRAASCSRTPRPARGGRRSEMPNAECRMLNMKAPDIKTPLPGPKARAIIDKDAKFVSPSYTRDYPLVIARGEGAVVEDVDGNVFLDCAAGIAVNSTGVSHPEVVKAIADQAAKFIPMSGTDFSYKPQVRLAEELSKLVPIDGSVRTFFGDSETEASEDAVKLSRYCTQRPNVIA